MPIHCLLVVSLLCLRVAMPVKLRALFQLARPSANDVAQHDQVPRAARPPHPHLHPRFSPYNPPPRDRVVV